MGQQQQQLSNVLYVSSTLFFSVSLIICLLNWTGTRVGVNIKCRYSTHDQWGRMRGYWGWGLTQHPSCTVHHHTPWHSVHPSAYSNKNCLAICLSLLYSICFSSPWKKQKKKVQQYMLAGRPQLMMVRDFSRWCNLKIYIPPPPHQM